ncbi:hypothetical protein HPB51_028686 [Rhipicephalus microplus]|uniref:Uncharacterized protein n=1 Tax=Rhipicephalus microplus TaxID=6941 RepID=A0A9J6CWA8_RHIMP|nr:hypothetical protein HPB51_028686 [Rhipicephalus microplus]
MSPLATAATRALSTKAFWLASANPTEDLTHAPSKSRPPGPRHANRHCANAPRGPEEQEEARKSSSSFSGCIPTNRGSDTSLPASSRSSTRANLPELFALLATQRKADQGKRQRDDFEEPTKPSVHRRRGRPPTKTTSGRTPSDERNIWLRHQHQAVASGLRPRKCSGHQRLSKTSLEGGPSCLERLQKPKAVADFTAVVVWRMRQKFAILSKPGRRMATFRKTGVPALSWARLDVEVTSTIWADRRRGVRGLNSALLGFVVIQPPEDDDDEDDDSCLRPLRGGS